AATFQYIVSDGFLTAVGNVSFDFAPVFQWHNSVNGMDVDNDGFVSPGEALTVINTLNAVGPTPLLSLSVGNSIPPACLDVNPDKYLTPGDALDVINYLNANPSGAMSVSQVTTNAAETDLAVLSLLSAPRDKVGRFI